MNRLPSKLQRALIFLSHVDAAGQHLVDVYAIDDLVYFRVSQALTIVLQCCPLSDLAALLSRPERAIKAEIRAANGCAKGDTLDCRLQLFKVEKARGQRLMALLKAPP